MKTKFIICIALFTLTSCVSGLNSYQENELKEIKHARPDIYTESKNPQGAAALGLFIGFGSFYTGNIATGVASLLLWPLSILWDPINGYNGAMKENYFATKYRYKELKEKGEVKENFF